MSGDIQAAWAVLQILLMTGFVFGVIVAVIVGAIKIGWNLAPYIVIGAALVWFFGG